MTLMKKILGVTGVALASTFSSLFIKLIFII